MKRKPLPNTRLDWRDPEMPVVRQYKMADGTTRTEIDPDYERRYREFLVSSSPNPHFDADPTYNLRKAKS